MPQDPSQINIEYKAWSDSLKRKMELATIIAKQFDISPYDVIDIANSVARQYGGTLMAVLKEWVSNVGTDI